MQEIPLTREPRQKMTVVLGGQPVELTVWWQPISDSWYLSLTTETGAPIAHGRQIASRSAVIASTAFEGEVVAVPLLRDDTTAVERDAWGETHRLLYLTPDELRQGRAL